MCVQSRPLVKSSKFERVLSEGIHECFTYLKAAVSLQIGQYKEDKGPIDIPGTLPLDW
jgi:hypothetical protein